MSDSREAVTSRPDLERIEAFFKRRQESGWVSNSEALYVIDSLVELVSWFATPELEGLEHRQGYGPSDDEDPDEFDTGLCDVCEGDWPCEAAMADRILGAACTCKPDALCKLHGGKEAA